MMFCFKTSFKTYTKGQKILTQGDPFENLALILKGSATVEHIDHLANVSIIMHVKKGDVYGVEDAYTGANVYRDSLVANEKCLVLLMNKHRALNPCENKCRRHDLVVKNLMRIVAENNSALLEKLYHMSKRTIRDKLLSYLSSMAAKSSTAYFEIPFNKTELANYLSVDRSAMSTELGKMRDEGIVDYDKKQYKLNLKKIS